MPVCEIYFTRNYFSKTELEKITDRLTNLLLQAEGFEINQISRSLCLINLIPGDCMVIGGKISELGKVVVKIHVFAEAYSDTTKKELFVEITKIFTEESLNCRSQEGNNIWCLILPVEKNNFGAGGRVATLGEIKAFISSLSKEEHLKANGRIDI